jgi:hypothetical protein
MNKSTAQCNKYEEIRSSAFFCFIPCGSSPGGTEEGHSLTGLGDYYVCGKLGIPDFPDKWLINFSNILILTHRSCSTTKKHYFSASEARFC